MPLIYHRLYQLNFALILSSVCGEYNRYPLFTGS